MTCYALSKLSLKLICSVMSAKIGQAKSAGRETSAYYAGQYFVALSFYFSVCSLRVSLLEMAFLCVGTDCRTDRRQGCDLRSGLVGATEWKDLPSCLTLLVFPTLAGIYINASQYN